MAHRTTCPNCASGDLLVVSLVPRDTPLRFTTCRHCEHRWWQDAAAGVEVTLSSVISGLQAVG